MAPKRPTPVHEPHVSSEEEEEEASSSGDEEEEKGSSEEEEEEMSGKKPSAPQSQSQKPRSKPSSPSATSSSGEEEEEEGSSSEEEEKMSPKKRSAPQTQTQKPRSKPSSPPPTLPAVKSGKRISETDRDAKDSKRPKAHKVGALVSAEKSEYTKKQLFQRLWSEGDEIAVLKGITEFTEKRGIDPAKDMNGFFDYIKNSLHFDVSLPQLKDKVSRLKKKFGNQAKKGKKGQEKTFSKLHDQMAFDLSKKIWGNGGLSSGNAGVVKPGVVKSDGKSPKKSVDSGWDKKKLEALKEELGMEVAKENGGANMLKFDSGLMGLERMEDYVVKRGLEILEEGKKAEMEERWRKLHVAELELFLKRQELIKEQAELMLAAYKMETDED